MLEAVAGVTFQLGPVVMETSMFLGAQYLEHRHRDPEAHQTSERGDTVLLLCMASCCVFSIRL